MSDPTKIEISFDPRERRMRGTTAHKLMDFDVPFMSHITGNLWVGGCTNGLILPAEIKHLVSLYVWEEYIVQHDLGSKLVVCMYDSLDQAMGQVKGIAAWVNSCLEDGPTLVHCQAGLNRSNLVAATALIENGMNPAHAINFLRERRSNAVLCNDAFCDWLLRGDHDD